MQLEGYHVHEMAPVNEALMELKKYVTRFKIFYIKHVISGINVVLLLKKRTNQI